MKRKSKENSVTSDEARVLTHFSPSKKSLRETKMLGDSDRMSGWSNESSSGIRNRKPRELIFDRK